MRKHRKPLLVIGGVAAVAFLVALPTLREDPRRPRFDALTLDWKSDERESAWFFITGTAFANALRSQTDKELDRILPYAVFEQWGYGRIEAWRLSREFRSGAAEIAAMDATFFDPGLLAANPRMSAEDLYRLLRDRVVSNQDRALDDLMARLETKFRIGSMSVREILLECQARSVVERDISRIYENLRRSASWGSPSKRTPFDVCFATAIRRKERAGFGTWARVLRTRAEQESLERELTDMAKLLPVVEQPDYLRRVGELFAAEREGLRNSCRLIEVARTLAVETRR